MISFDDAFAELPLIAILRGLEPAEALEVGGALIDEGFRILEVPLNSPTPFESIARLAEGCSGRAVIGAGTVLDAGSVRATAAAGGRLIVMPHGDPQVVRAAKALDLTCCPGVATPTEAFAALAAGADALKLFPAESIPPVTVGALRAVLPATARLVPVGGIKPDSMASYRKAGADGFGLGSALFKPGRSIGEVRGQARRFVSAWQELS